MSHADDAAKKRLTREEHLALINEIANAAEAERKAAAAKRLNSEPERAIERLTGHKNGCPALFFDAGECNCKEPSEADVSASEPQGSAAAPMGDVIASAINADLDADEVAAKRITREDAWPFGQPRFDPNAIPGAPTVNDARVRCVRLIHTSFGKRDWRFLWLRRVRVRRDLGRFRWPTI